jgi:hypothetical protein
MESEQSPSDYSESLDSLQTRLQTESDWSPTSLLRSAARIQLVGYFNLESIYYCDSNPQPPGLMTNEYHY